MLSKAAERIVRFRSVNGPKVTGVKSLDSILLKYERYYPEHQTRKVFNDILGFRAFCDSYSQVLEGEIFQFRIADMTSGKAVDDGYRGVHVYYQKSGRHYPIEIQFNTLFDRQLNNWLHEYLYKKNYPIEIGKIIRKIPGARPPVLNCKRKMNKK